MIRVDVHGTVTPGLLAALRALVKAAEGCPVPGIACTEIGCAQSAG